MIENFKSKALKKFWEKNDPSGIRADWIPKVSRILDALDNAICPEDLNLPGFGFHPLRGNLEGRFALTVSRNWRITFSWHETHAIDVDLEDYHD